MLHMRRFYDDLWRRAANLPEEYKDHIVATPDELAESEWSKEFEKLMRARLVFGAYRYGRMGHGRIPPGKPVYDRIKSIRRRLDKYEKTGNAEWLVDIANMSLLMFEESTHPNHHFRHTDGDAEDSYHDEIK